MNEKSQIEIQDEEELTEASSEAAQDEGDASEETENESVSEKEELEQKLEKAQLEAQKNYDRLLRVSAEFDNYKKRTTREMGELAKFANERILKELLAIVDNLERAIVAADQENNVDHPLVEGIHLTLSELLKIFKNHQVVPIEALGEVFDPTFHQAMMQEETDEHPANTVIQELQKGYLIHERLLRPAMVVVAKAKDGQTETNE